MLSSRRPKAKSQYNNIPTTQLFMPLGVPVHSDTGLQALLVSPSPPACLFVYSPSNLDLTCALIEAAIRRLRSETQPATYVTIDLTEVDSPRAFFDRTIQALLLPSGIKPPSAAASGLDRPLKRSRLAPHVTTPLSVSSSDEAAYPSSLQSLVLVGRRYNESLGAFLATLHDLSHHLGPPQPIFLIVCYPERIRAWKDSFLAVLTRLPELTKAKVHCILISMVEWNKIRPANGVCEPRLWTMPHSASESMDLLGFPEWKQSWSSSSQNQSANVIFQAFASQTCLDLSHLEDFFERWSTLPIGSENAFTLLPKHREQLETFRSEIGKAIWKSAPPLSNMAQYRVHSTTDHQPAKITNPTKLDLGDFFSYGSNKIKASDVTTSELEKTFPSLSSSYTHRHVCMSKCSDIALISAVLGSYNPQRSDAKLLSHTLGGERRRRKRVSRKPVDPTRLQSSHRQSTLGPRPFPLERLLAIHRFLLLSQQLDNCTDKVDILSQLGSLCSSNTLIRASAVSGPNADRLDGIKFKSGFNIGQLEEIAKALDIDVATFLYQND